MIAGSAAGILVAESTYAELVVASHRGHGGFPGLLAGSVATQLVTHARCPVIVVRPQRNGEPAEAPTGAPVVVGVDGSVHSEAAVAFAFEEAANRAVPLTTVHIWTEPPRPGQDDFKPVECEPGEARHEAERTLAEAIAGYRDKYPDVAVTSDLVCSLYITETLLQRTGTAGLMVVGARGRGPLSGLLLGSVSQALIHRAHCPVAVIHSNPDLHD